MINQHQSLDRDVERSSVGDSEQYIGALFEPAIT